MKKLSLLLSAFVIFNFISLHSYASDVAVKISNKSIFVSEPNGLPKPSGDEYATLSKIIQPESIIYFPIENATRAEDFSDLRVVIDWYSGEELTSPPIIEYKKVYDAEGNFDSYKYVVALQTIDVTDNDKHNIAGKIKIAKRRSSIADEIDFSFNMQKNALPELKDSIICYSKSLAANFNGLTGLANLSFYDIARFEIEIDNQGPVNIGCSTTSLTDVQLQYPNASMRFISWTKPPIFNRNGTLYIYSSPDEYIYELRSDGLVRISGVYSDEHSAFTFSTRRLSTFIISDTPLDEPLKNYAPENPPVGACENFCDKFNH